MTGINAAMVAIAKEIATEGIGKSRKNVQQGYNFRGVDEVMNAFAPILAKHSVFVRPKFADRQVTERVTKNGTALFYVSVAGDFTFTHEDGSGVTVGPFFGEAMDSGDKATNKAMAVAFKYAMFQTFCVPLEGVTGGDADQTTHEVAPAMPTGKPTDGAWEAMGDEEQAYLTREAEKVIQIFKSGDVEAAHDHYVSLSLDSDEKSAIWTRFDSKLRSALKKADAAAKANHAEAASV